jgi:hypothetical protein
MAKRTSKKEMEAAFGEVLTKIKPVKVVFGGIANEQEYSAIAAQMWCPRRRCDKCGRNFVQVIPAYLESEPSKLAGYMLRCEQCGTETDRRAFEPDEKRWEYSPEYIFGPREFVFVLSGSR